MQNKIIKTMMLIIYISLFCLSGWLTIKLWQSNTSLGFWIATSIGACLHASLYLFSAAASGLNLTRLSRSITWFVVGVLFVLSIIATIGQLESSHTVADKQYQQQKNTTTYNQRIIALRLQNAETYARYNRATKSTVEIDKLSQLKQQTIKQPINYGAMHNMVLLLANVLPISEANIRLSLFLLLAVLLDSCGLWSAFLLFKPTTPNHRVLIHQGNCDYVTAQQPTIELARAEIQAGIFGDKISVTKLCERYKIGRGTANNWLHELSDEGLVKISAKNRWELITNN